MIFMKKNMLIIITAAEVIGFLLISWLVPAERLQRGCRDAAAAAAEFYQ